MTEEQIAYLKENDIPYSESLFIYVGKNFKKYLSILKLAGHRAFGWDDSEKFEELYSKLIKE